MNNKLKNDAVDYLFDAVLQLQSKEECYNFFEDLCTVNELLSLSQRFDVAAMLRNKKTYLEIAEKTGASTATISRVKDPSTAAARGTVAPCTTSSTVILGSQIPSSGTSAPNMISNPEKTRTIGSCFLKSRIKYRMSLKME